MKIAISGKGGCGKTTITALLSKAFSRIGFKVTVIDADESNVGLAMMLGLDQVKSMVEVYGGRKGLKVLLDEEMKRPSNVEIMEANKNGVRIMRIGKIEKGGEGCACLFGVLTKKLLSSMKYSENEVVLVDMDAGIEHLGRGIDQAVDAMLFVVDPTFDSIILAEKANRMARELGVTRFMVVLNKVDEETLGILRDEVSKANVKIVGSVRYDPEVVKRALLGLPISDSMAMRDAIELAKTIISELKERVRCQS